MKKLLAAAAFLAATSSCCLADANLNCDAYAFKAVAQQNENQAAGCGYTGGRWSTDYQGHLNWCRSPGVGMANLTAEDNARIAGLQQCKAKAAQAASRTQYCQKYAGRAAALREQINAVCKSDGEWPVPPQQDIDFCLEKGGSFADLTNSNREKKIQGCQMADDEEVSQLGHQEKPPMVAG